jgi:hypothetical protein
MHPTNIKDKNIYRTEGRANTTTIILITVDVLRITTITATQRGAGSKVELRLPIVAGTLCTVADGCRRPTGCRVTL